MKASMVGVSDHDSDHKALIDFNETLHTQVVGRKISIEFIDERITETVSKWRRF